MVAGIVGLLSCAWIPGVDLVIAGLVLMLYLAIEDYVNYIDAYSQYLLTGDSRLEQQIENEAFWSTTSLLLNLVLMYFLWAVFDGPVPEEPVDGIIEGEGGTTGGETGGTTGGETGGTTGGETGGTGEGGSIPGESGSTSKYLEQLDNLSENKINHIINGSKNSNHGWEKLVPDKNWSDIKNIIANVMDTGVEGPYKSVFSKKATINGFEVEVTYTKLSDDTIKISDAWVNQ